jgi:hypothetical protein
LAGLGFFGVVSFTACLARLVVIRPIIPLGLGVPVLTAAIDAAFLALIRLIMPRGFFAGFLEAGGLAAGLGAAFLAAAFALRFASNGPDRPSLSNILSKFSICFVLT